MGFSIRKMPAVWHSFCSEYPNGLRKEDSAMSVPEHNILVHLSDTDLVLEHVEEDVRDYNVFDADGENIGYVSDLMIDSQEKKVRFLLVAYGGFLGIGERQILIPVDSIKVIKSKEREIHVTHQDDYIAKSPVYDPHLVPFRPQIDELYAYYGIAPYWGSGYLYPPFPFISDKNIGPPNDSEEYREEDK